MLMSLAAKFDKQKGGIKVHCYGSNVTLSSDRGTVKKSWMVLDHKRISYDIEQCQESDSSQLLVCFYLP